MTGIHERWDAVMSLFGDVLDASPDERERMLAAHATIDADVVAEVRSLLAAHNSIGDRFAKPALALLGDSASEWLDASVPTLAGQVVGTYQVARKIGEGGMGAVYEATRVGDAYQQRVALKTISRGADSQTIVQRFRRERQILAGLQHPNIAAMYDGGVTTAGTPYLVMEFVDGLTIDAWCAQHQLTIAQRLDLFRQICGAVQHAHRRLVVHRDIKPGNILVSNEGVVKLLDFGIAKLVTSDTDGSSSDPSVTRDGLTPLSTAYASPEQARGDVVSTATDVYSLGVVLYQLLCGEAPFQVRGKSPAQVLASVVEDTPPLPSNACTDAAAKNCRVADRGRLSKQLAGELDAIVSMAMRKEPERRYVSVDAFADDVHKYLRGLPVSARPDTLGYRTRKFVERRRALVFTSAGAFAVVAIFGAVSLVQARDARMEAARTLRISNFMQSVLGAADVTGVGGSLPRVGPRASVSALLDSALKRVPQEFPGDPAVRARLYTTIGSSLLTQTRLREAYSVLDSAITLSRQSYGANSQEFAVASNEAGVAALHRNRLDEAQHLVTNAQRALEQQELTHTEIYAQTYVNLSSIALVRGEYKAMDSLAHRAMDLETERTPRASGAKAAAMNRMASMLMIRNKPAAAESLYHRALIMFDSLHAPSSLERLDITNNFAGSLMVQGKFTKAESVLVAGERLANEMIGADSREAALMISSRSLARLFQGDTAQSRILADRAGRIVDSIPEMVVAVAENVRFASAAYYANTLQWRAADSVLTRSLASFGSINKGIGLFQTLIYGGSVKAMLRELPQSLHLLTRAESVYVSSGFEQPVSLNELQISLAAVYTRLGRQEDAERYYPFLKPEQVAGIKGFAAQQHVADSTAMANAKNRVRAPSPF